MVSAKLVQKIEDHWDAIAARAIRRMRACADLPHLQQMPESEVHQIGQRTLHNLSHWLTANPEKEIALRYQDIGRQRCSDGMPLHEAVRGLQLIKEAAVDYIGDQGLPANAVELVAEEELEQQLDRFFDLQVFYLVKGYEQELRKRMTAAAAAGRH
jgi:hypothetical protein